MTVHRLPHPVTRLARWVLPACLCLLALLVLALWALPALWTSTDTVGAHGPSQRATVRPPMEIPQVIAGAFPSAASPIVAQQAHAAGFVTTPPAPLPSLPAVPTWMTPAPTPPVETPPLTSQEPVVQTAPRVAAPVRTQGTEKPPAPKKVPWVSLVTRTVVHPTAAQGATVAVPTDTTQGTTAANTSLIQHARWEVPAFPLQTLYRSQTLAGRLLQALSSDVAGQLKIVLTIPVFDKFGQGVTILPKDTLVIARQASQPQFGQTRLQILLEQLELPSGEIVDLKATVGEEDGSNGLKGRVNNHYGKLLLATGISALLNIGVRSAVGTPGPHQFFQNPVQEAARDVGESVQREAQSVVEKQLKVPPTIERKADTFCTISLLENVTFNRPPVVVK